ncbi:hypothetical protein BC829DRAFT_408862 [Chytridium lagenaria]|nr:hypothetical protein BC829DRAFT_408862 [Chytridium lagenaria]
MVRFTGAFIAVLVAAVANMASGQVLDKNSFTERQLYDRHMATLDRVYSNVISANKGRTVLRQTRTVPEGTFASNVVGRIHPFGRMNNLDDTMDYFWGLFGSNNPSNTLQLFPEVLSYKISAFANTGLAAHAFVDLTVSDLKGGQASIRAQAQFLFEERASGSVITQYDRIHGSMEKLDMVGKTCKAQRAICGKGLSSPWPLANCEIALAFKGLGEAAIFGSDSILCRAGEVNLAYLRKDIHCNNLGPSGGSKCVDSEYTDYFVPIGRPFTDTPSTKDASNVQQVKDFAEAKYTTIYPGNLHGQRLSLTIPLDVSGPIGIFTNTEDTVEYQFGIFGSDNPEDLASGLIPVISDLRSTDMVAATSIDYVMMSLITKKTYPLRVQGFWFLNDAYEVSGYDVQVHNSGRFNDEVAFNVPDWLSKPALAAAICISQSRACKGKNQVYGGPGQPECFTHFIGTIPIGDGSQVAADSVQPEHHCAHVSPSGGGKCVDIPYDDYFTVPFKNPFFGY